MHCKKGVIFALVFAVFLLSQFAFVAAAGETTERFTNLLDGIGGFIEPLSKGILGDSSGTDELAMQECTIVQFSELYEIWIIL